MIITRKKVDEATKLLELPIDATKEQITEAYRAKARIHHPDAGGNAEDFARVDWAKHVMLGWLSNGSPAFKPPMPGTPCPRCDGKGFIDMRRGFGPVSRRQCPQCRGTGDIDVEQDKMDT